MNLRKVGKIAKVLIQSQLRSGRGGTAPSFFSRSTFIVVADVLAFLSSVIAVYAVLQFIPAQYQNLLPDISKQALIFLPTFVPAIVLLGGMMFELSASSRFASSDVVNWLPLSQTEYVAASAVSIAFIYSPWVAIGLGATLAPAIQGGMISIWVASTLLSLFLLVVGGVLVEMMRAGINRVSSAFYKKAGRGTLVVRLIITVIIVLAFEMFFNPTYLMYFVNAFTSTLDVTAFIPLIWASLAIRAMMEGNLAISVLFSASTILFGLVMLWAAVRIRSRFWSPYQVAIKITKAAYTPRPGFLQSLGFSPAESSLIKKDLRGLTRRREMLSFLALPAVMTILLVVQQLTLPSGGTTTAGRFSFITWFIGGFFAIFISATSVGQEGKAVVNIYSMPLSADQLFRAKVTSSLLVSLIAAVAVFLVTSALSEFDLISFVVILLLSIGGVVEGVLIGFAFATRYPDFQERPRPRFLSPMAIFASILVGILAILATVMPTLFFASTPNLERIGVSTVPMVISIIVFAVVTITAYYFAKSGARRLVRELII